MVELHQTLDGRELDRVVGIGDVGLRVEDLEDARGRGGGLLRRRHDESDVAEREDQLGERLVERDETADREGALEHLPAADARG